MRKYLLVAAILMAGLLIYGCATNTAQTTAKSGTASKKSGASRSMFALTGAVGWAGGESIAVQESVLNQGPAWTITNKNWNAAAVFTVSLGEKRLGQFVGLECKVRAEAPDLVWKRFALDAPKDGLLGPIETDPKNNISIGTANTELAGEVGKITEISIPFTALDSEVASLSGDVQLAIGISAPGGSAYTLFDLQLIPVEEGATSWTEALPLKDALLPWFEYFGFAVTAPELQNPYIAEGLAHHCNSTTVGNEFKPDYILGKEPSEFGSYLAGDGKKYQVPASLFFDVVDASLAACRDNNLSLRGHTLVWHSQTPKWFFRENFKNTGALVDIPTMNARQEWYIRSLLEHIKAWEEKNNAGKRVITSWDVVNEAVSDGANEQYWLRTNGDWFAIYKDDSFIVNAFVLANTYAPKEVGLTYNDYNCYVPAKTAGILKLVKAIQENPKARIDAIGMQSHVKIDFPGPSSFRRAVDSFLETGLDVQITELDIHSVMKTEAAKKQLAAVYKDYFSLFIEKRKTPTKNGIQGITIWGISDANTWLSNHHKITSYPLLFDAWFNTKPAFDAVLEAAKQ